MKKSIILLSAVLSFTAVTAQIHLPGYNQEMVADNLYGRWHAHWILLKGEPQNIYGVYNFRKTFDLPSKPGKFVIHVTADNRYKLYVNGQLVSLGPSRCDTYNWNFATVDIAPYLNAGKNVLAAEVWNYAADRPAAQMTFGQTGLLVQGNTKEEEIVNTDNTWKAIRNEAYSDWRSPMIVSTYFCGPGEKIDASKYPWGWQQTEFDDSAWKGVEKALYGAMKDTRNYRGRMLVPCPIPPMEMTPTRFKSVRIAEGQPMPEGFVEGMKPVTIPAHSKVRLVLDQDSLTTGYLHLKYSDGEGSKITVGYTEAYYDVPADVKRTDRMPKGDRNKVEGKTFFGTQDIISPDGGRNREYTPLWYRCWRYVEQIVETGDAPLTLDDISSTFSAYPFKKEWSFSSPEAPELERMMEIGWRTARLCANENYMDCPYYEQLQYWGDTRIQALITMFNTSDTLMVRNALEHGRQSINAEGITRSRYPSDRLQFISSFSLLWACMAHDYWMYRNDEKYVKSLLPQLRGVMSWYEQWMKEDNSLARVPHWYFADWVKTFPNGGEPIREKEGNSAFQDLLYVYTLDLMADLENSIGLPAIADHYEELTAKIRSDFKKKYWRDDRQMFADTRNGATFSQHVNALAVLTHIVEGEDAKNLMHRILNDKDIAQATIYFRYYVNRALAEAGLGDEYIDNLQPWREQMALNLTTWAETPEPSRSDCHAWSSAPNIEFFRVVLGIDSDKPGFRHVRIAPSLGMLKEVSGTMPHILGPLTVKYKKGKNNALTADITLPEGLSGDFVWNGKTYALHSGSQKLKL